MKSILYINACVRKESRTRILAEQLLNKLNLPCEEIRLVDLSFPAMLKQYLELINVVGVTFKYSKEGVPLGRCRAESLFYVTTAGGQYVPEEFGFGYVKALAQNFYGIPDVRKIEAAGLDIYGADVDAIMERASAGLLHFQNRMPVPQA